MPPEHEHLGAWVNVAAPVRTWVNVAAAVSMNVNVAAVSMETLTSVRREP